jgi:hypothetical protein
VPRRGLEAGEVQYVAEQPADRRAEHVQDAVALGWSGLGRLRSHGIAPGNNSPRSVVQQPSQ